MAVEIRFASFNDVDRMADMGQAMHAESPRYATRPFDWGQVRTVVDRFVRDESSDTCALLAVKDGETIGMLAGMVARDWFGSAITATDVVFYVDPAHRGGRAALLLVTTFEAWARDAGAVLIVPGITSGLRMESTLAFYEKLGYEHVGHVLSKDLK